MTWIYAPDNTDRVTVYDVGFYDPKGEFVYESTWEAKDEAAARVSYLNGGQAPCIRPSRSALRAVVQLATETLVRIADPEQRRACVECLAEVEDYLGTTS